MVQLAVEPRAFYVSTSSAILIICVDAHVEEGLPDDEATKTYGERRR